MINTTFENKTVIITGGGGGLASAMIDSFLALKANVVALDLDVSALTKSANLLPITVDITDKDSIAAAIEQTIKCYGKIDVLMNNAGITHMSLFKDTSIDLFSRIMAVNFTGAVDITRICMPYLIENQGQIIAVSSVAGFAPLYGRSAYSASKHAMEGFFKSLASEVEEFGVSVLVVSPSFINSRPELTTKANSGISSPGATKKSIKGAGLSPTFAAQKIMKAVRQKKSVLYLGQVSKVAYWLQALLPNTYLRIMKKSAKTEFT